MTKDTLNNLLAELKKNLSSLLGDNLKQLILYGSFASKRNDSESDIDIIALVSLNREKINNLEAHITSLSTDLSLKYDTIVSLLVKNEQEFNNYSEILPFYNSIVKEGKIIYG